MCDGKSPDTLASIGIALFKKTYATNFDPTDHVFSTIQLASLHSFLSHL
jgi:hypothetical protein